MIKKVLQCRICHKKTLTKFLDLGNIPLPNGFIKQKDLHKKELKYPLTVCSCNNCGLVQLGEIINPKIMFHNYVYIPSASKTRMKNFEQIVNQSLKMREFNNKSLAIDIGSNDGSLLTFFKNRNIRTLGIDPASNLAKIAELNGIETINNYISVPLAKQIRKKYGPAKVITATNVVAHIDNLLSLLSSIEILLDKGGVFICEFPYLLDLIGKNQFDTIYHEHLSYFSIKPLSFLLAQTKLHFSDIQRTTIDGGSLRIFLSKQPTTPKTKNKIKKLINLEINNGLYDIKYLYKFENKVKNIRHDLVKLLTNLKTNGKSVAAYGAAAKGNILLNYCKINKRLISFAVDSTPYKQGLYTPGTYIPIVSEAELYRRKPDYTLILAWNFSKEIMNKEKAYSNNGGKFIIPVPKVEIL